jgi:hypothetical protein
MIVPNMVLDLTTVAYSNRAIFVKINFQILTLVQG